MNLDHIRLPPVSRKFYNKLLLVFPPINPLDIHKGTDMIDIQRSAAQQEVLDYIHKVVVDSDTEEGPVFTTIWDKFKYVFTA